MKCGGDHLTHNAWLHQTPVCDAVLARPEEALVSLSFGFNGYDRTHIKGCKSCRQQ